jgi:glutaryl-CoA dehydrogenase
MHLTGYGCAGASAVAYGLACLELEAGDSGVRSLVSVQGSLAMYAIWKFGSEEQKQRWLPALAAGDAIGCFGLTEPDHGSDPAVDGHPRPARRLRLGAQRQQDVDHQRAGRRRRGDLGPRRRGNHRLRVPMDTPGVSAREIKHKMSLRASSTGEIVLADVRLPADAQLPEARSLKAPLSCLSQARYGIVWGALGAARECLHVTIDYAKSREQFGKPIARSSSPRPSSPTWRSSGRRATCWRCTWAGRADAETLRPHQVSVGKLNNVREALENRPHLPHGAGRERHQRGVPGAPAREQPRERAHVRGHERDPPARHRPAAHRPVRLRLSRSADYVASTVDLALVARIPGD